MSDADADADVHSHEGVNTIQDSRDDVDHASSFQKRLEFFKAHQEQGARLQNEQRLKLLEMEERSSCIALQPRQY